MALNTEHFSRCIATLEASLKHLKSVKADTIEFEVFRNAVIKGFELTLETAGKLLRKILKSYEANPGVIDELTYKEVFRRGVKHGIFSSEAIKRWFQYRDNRNNTAHDYGIAFAEETLKLLPLFIADAKKLEAKLQEIAHAKKT